MESGPPSRPDSVRKPSWRRREAVNCRKNPAFLTRSPRDATYSVGMNVAYQESHNRARAEFRSRPLSADRSLSGCSSRITGSPLRRRMLRVMMDVHNNKEMGP
jgi:hypothetical protein